MFLHQFSRNIFCSSSESFCQTLGLVLRLRVDFVLPLSQEQQEEEEQEPSPKASELEAV